MYYFISVLIQFFNYCRFKQIYSVNIILNLNFWAKTVARQFLSRLQSKHRLVRESHIHFWKISPYLVFADQTGAQCICVRVCSAALKCSQKRKYPITTSIGPSRSGRFMKEGQIVLKPVRPGIKFLSITFYKWNISRGIFFRQKK